MKRLTGTLAGVLIAVVVCGLGPGAGPAHAACPTMPADYTGSDVVVDELRDLRRDQVTACNEINASVTTVNGNVQTLKNAVGPANDSCAASSTLIAFTRCIKEALGGNTASGKAIDKLTNVDTSTADVKNNGVALKTPAGGQTNLVELVDSTGANVHNTVRCPTCPTGSGGGGSGPVGDATDPQFMKLAGFSGDGETWVNDWNQTLWFLPGLLVGLLAAYCMWRVFKP